MPKHSSHDWNSNTGRCNACDAHVLAFEANYRCIPVKIDIVRSDYESVGISICFPGRWLGTDGNYYIVSRSGWYKDEFQVPNPEIDNKPSREWLKWIASSQDSEPWVEWKSVNKDERLSNGSSIVIRTEIKDGEEIASDISDTLTCYSKPEGDGPPIDDGGIFGAWLCDGPPLDDGGIDWWNSIPGD